MKRRFLVISLLSVFALGLLPAQNLDKILDKYFETIGQETLLKVESMVTTGTIEQMGMNMPFKFIAKRPGKAYMEVEVTGVKMRQGYDGETGWMIMPLSGSMEPVEMSGPELRGLKEMSDMDGKLWEYKKKGHQLELMGTEDMEGTKVYVMKLTEKDGNVTQMYLDAEKYIMLKAKTNSFVQGTEVEVISLMSDYTEFDGYLMPLTTKQMFGGVPGMTLTIDDIKQNVDIDDSLFSKPASPASNEE